MITGNYDRIEKEARQSQYARIPSGKLKQYDIYVQHKLDFLEDACQVYMSPKYTRLKLDQYICSSKAIATIAKEIIEVDERKKLKKALLFYGNWHESFNSILSEYTRAPQKRLKLYFEGIADIVYINEYRTARICNKRFNNLEIPRAPQR